MTAWIIEPRDSLIVRDGRPFGLGAGRQATSLDFPFPSTTTGGVRTRAGLDRAGVFDLNFTSVVKDIGVKGPILVELNELGNISDWLMPAPADALLARIDNDDDRANIKVLSPIDVASDWTNLEADLRPVSLSSALKGKPSDEPPRYWYWDRFRQWLIEAKDQTIDLKDLGHNGPEKDSRVHVGIGLESLTSGEGELFQTRGLEFRRAPSGVKALKDPKRLAMVVFVADQVRSREIAEGLAPLGGERRLVVWRKDKGDAASDISKCLDAIAEKIVETGHCRLLLLTPAVFKMGSLPETLLLTHTSGITPKLKAIAHNRYQVVSGWDFETDKPKPTRRLLPSGSVLFLELTGDKENRIKWIENVWLNCVSDADSDNKDGFGLAVLGGWDGRLLHL